MKLDNDGDVVWVQKINGTVYGIAEARNGYVLTGEWSDGQYMVVKTNDIGQYHQYDADDDFDYDLRGVYNMTYYNSRLSFILPPHDASRIYYHFRIENGGNVYNSEDNWTTGYGIMQYSITSLFPRLVEGDIKLTLIVDGVVKDVFEAVITDLFDYDLTVPSYTNNETSTISYDLPVDIVTGTTVMLKLIYDNESFVDITATASAGENTFDLLSYIPENNGAYTPWSCM